jgi:asparagine synthase (glutamine-hydrolysing)
MGFTAPLESWLHGPLRGWASDLLSTERLKRQGLLNPEVVWAIWTDYLAHGRSSPDQIWSLLMLQTWLEARGK